MSGTTFGAATKIVPQYGLMTITPPNADGDIDVQSDRIVLAGTGASSIGDSGTLLFSTYSTIALLVAAINGVASWAAAINYSADSVATTDGQLKVNDYGVVGNNLTYILADGIELSKSAGTFLVVTDATAQANAYKGYDLKWTSNATNDTVSFLPGNAQDDELLVNSRFSTSGGTYDVLIGSAGSEVDQDYDIDSDSAVTLYQPILWARLTAASRSVKLRANAGSTELYFDSLKLGTGNAPYDIQTLDTALAVYCDYWYDKVSDSRFVVQYDDLQYQFVLCSAFYVAYQRGGSDAFVGDGASPYTYTASQYLTICENLLADVLIDDNNDSTGYWYATTGPGYLADGEIARLFLEVAEELAAGDNKTNFIASAKRYLDAVLYEHRDDATGGRYHLDNMVQEDDASLTYTGTWTRDTGGVPAYNFYGYKKHTSTAGDNVVIYPNVSFRYFKLIGWKATTTDTIKIETSTNGVDWTERQAALDISAASTEYFACLWSYDFGSASSDYRIRVTNNTNGKYLVIDAYEYGTDTTGWLNDTTYGASIDGKHGMNHELLHAQALKRASELSTYSSFVGAFSGDTRTSADLQQRARDLVNSVINRQGVNGELDRGITYANTTAPLSQHNVTYQAVTAAFLAICGKWETGAEQTAYYAAAKLGYDYFESGTAAGIYSSMASSGFWDGWILYDTVNGYLNRTNTTTQGGSFILWDDEYVNAEEYSLDKTTLQNFLCQVDTVNGYIRNGKNKAAPVNDQSMGIGFLWLWDAGTFDIVKPSGTYDFTNYNDVAKTRSWWFDTQVDFENLADASNIIVNRSLYVADNATENTFGSARLPRDGGSSLKLSTANGGTTAQYAYKDLSTPTAGVVGYDWFTPSTNKGLTAGCFLYQGAGLSANYLRLVYTHAGALDGSKIAYYWNGGSYVATTINYPNDDKWHRVEIQIDGSECRFRIETDGTWSSWYDIPDMPNPAWTSNRVIGSVLFYGSADATHTPGLHYFDNVDACGDYVHNFDNLTGWTTSGSPTVSTDQNSTFLTTDTIVGRLYAGSIGSLLSPTTTAVGQTLNGGTITLTYNSSDSSDVPEAGWDSWGSIAGGKQYYFWKAVFSSASPYISSPVLSDLVLEFEIRADAYRMMMGIGA